MVLEAWLFVALLVSHFAVTTALLIWQAIQIRRSMELLAARSFGEYANGKAKLANPKPPNDFDPGF